MGRLHVRFRRKSLNRDAFGLPFFVDPEYYKLHSFIPGFCCVDLFVRHLHDVARFAQGIRLPLLPEGDRSLENVSEFLARMPVLGQ